jgi:hypothetical protein
LRLDALAAPPPPPSVILLLGDKDEEEEVVAAGGTPIKSEEPATLIAAGIERRFELSG